MIRPSAPESDMDLRQDIKEYLTELTTGLYDGYALDLEKLCKRLELKCYLADFENDKLSGAIMKDDDADSYSIYVNMHHHPNRRRFTIAHEIGHYVSYLKDSFSKEELEANDAFEDFAISVRQDGVYSIAETEANQIAAELLMPDDMVHELFRKGTSPEKMAHYFQVSESSMLIRLRDLNYRVVY